MADRAPEASSWDPTEAAASHQEETFLQILRSNWAWWAIPMLLVLVALLAVALLAQNFEGAPPIYSIF